MGIFNVIQKNLRTYCPKCKEEIYKHAHLCPRCHYDFNSPAHLKYVETINNLIRIWLFICFFIFMGLLLSGSGLGGALIFSLLLFSGGFWIIHRLSKYRNFFH